MAVSTSSYLDQRVKSLQVPEGEEPECSESLEQAVNSLSDDWIDSIFLLEYGIDDRERLKQKQKQWMENFSEYENFEEVWNEFEGRGHEPENYGISSFEDDTPMNCVGRALTAEIYRERSGYKPLNPLIQYVTDEDREISSAHVALMDEETEEVYGGQDPSVNNEILEPDSLLSLYLISSIAESLEYSLRDEKDLKEVYSLLEHSRPNSNYFEKKSEELKQKIS